MSRRIIPVTEARALPSLPVANKPHIPPREVRDALARPLEDLRISVTDRCNFRCVYCMPRSKFDYGYPFLPHTALLRFEEIERLARLFIALGVRKIRLTGGEPLLRKNVEVLIERLATLRTPEGRPLDLTLTTNGSLLARKAQTLKDRGLKRVTVSLDALDDALFRKINDAGFAVRDVLDGIATAQAVGLAPLKVNMVVKRGVNEGEILPMARHFRHSGITLRFIEFMDVGESNGWNMTEVLPSSSVIARINERYPLLPLDSHSAAETAQRWRYADGAGEIGVISSVTQAFCAHCTRARLSTEGKLYMCLFASLGYDLRALLRNGTDDATIAATLARIWQLRDDRYSQLRGSATVQTNDADTRRIEMSYIGG